MLDLHETVLEYEAGGFAKVRCGRCGEQLGRVQVTPPSEEDEPEEWNEKVQREIDALSDEHEAVCEKRNIV